MKRTYSAYGGGVLPYTLNNKRRRAASLSIAQSQQVRAIANQVVTRSGDTKYTDFYDSATVYNTGHLFSLASNLTKGDLGMNNYEGNEIKLSGLTVRAYWTSTNSYNTCRFIVFQWNDFSTPTPATILQDIATPASALIPLQPKQVGVMQQLRILYDEVVILQNPGGPVGTTLTTATHLHKRVYIPGKKLSKIRFNPLSNQVTTGSLWILAISDDAIGTAPGCFVTSRLSFTD